MEKRRQTSGIVVFRVTGRPERTGFIGPSDPMTTSGGSASHCSRRRPGEVPNTDEVVRRQAEQEHPTDPRTPAVARLTQQRHRLEPAEDFFDAFPRSLAERVAG